MFDDVIADHVWMKNNTWDGHLQLSITWINLTLDILLKIKHAHMDYLCKWQDQKST
jgi:hypothetical protein